MNTLLLVGLGKRDQQRQATDEIGIDRAIVRKSMKVGNRTRVR